MTIALNASLQDHDIIIYQLQQMFIKGIVTAIGVVDVTVIRSMIAPLNMTYTTGACAQYDLNTVHSLKMLLDFVAVNGGYACIEIDINSLYFRDNFNPCHF